MDDVDALLARLEELLAEVERLAEPARTQVLELLDGIDLLHRTALARLVEALGEDALERAGAAEPAVAWLLAAYGIGADQQTAAELALDEVRPYIHSHGGAVEVLDARAGIVRVRLSGACSGCTASAVTLSEGIERALRDGLAGFVRLEVEEDEAAAHPPPGPALLQIERLA